MFLLLTLLTKVTDERNFGKHGSEVDDRYLIRRATTEEHLTFLADPSSNHQICVVMQENMLEAILHHFY